jgi:uncharacterized protein YggT (Ycf19 family)
MSNLFHVLNAAQLLVIVDALLSWTMNPDTFPRSFTSAITGPVYAPIRELLGGLTGSVDLSPLVALGILQVLRALLHKEGYREPR